jgi:hypothetical protein
MAEERDEGHGEAPPARPRPRPRARRKRLGIQALAFAGVLAAGLLIGWVLFRDDDSSQAPIPTTPAVAGVAVDARVYPKLGLALSLPKGWTTAFRGAVLTAASRDETVSVAISSAGNADAGPRVRRADRRELTRLFHAREVGRQRSKVGTATTIVTELLGRARNRRPIRVLSMGPSSRWRTYSIQSFAVLQPTPARIAELRALLASVRYREPR